MSPLRYFMLAVKRAERARRNEERRERHDCEREYERAMDAVIVRFIAGELVPQSDIENLQRWSMAREKFRRERRESRKPV